MLYDPVKKETIVEQNYFEGSLKPTNENLELDGNKQQDEKEVEPSAENDNSKSLPLNFYVPRLSLFDKDLIYEQDLPYELTRKAFDETENTEHDSANSHNNENGENNLDSELVGSAITKQNQNEEEHDDIEAVEHDQEQENVEQSLPFEASRKTFEDEFSYMQPQLKESEIQDRIQVESQSQEIDEEDTVEEKKDEEDLPFELNRYDETVISRLENRQEQETETVHQENGDLPKESENEQNDHEIEDKDNDEPHFKAPATELDE